MFVGSFLPVLKACSNTMHTALWVNTEAYMQLTQRDLFEMHPNLHCLVLVSMMIQLYSGADNLPHDFWTLIWAPMFLIQRCKILLWPWCRQFGSGFYSISSLCSSTKGINIETCKSFHRRENFVSHTVMIYFELLFITSPDLTISLFKHGINCTGYTAIQ
jgi:hypothetical protein